MRNKRQLKKAAAEVAAAAEAAREAREHGMNAAAAQAAYLVGEAQKRAGDLIDEARKVAGPAAHEAKVRTADFAAKTLDAWEPHIKDALHKVAPVVDAARERVTDDFLPKVQGLLHDAAEHPVVAEAGRRGEAAVQALKGELEPKRAKGGKLKAFGKIVAIGAIVAGAVAAVRHFLTPKDDGWTAHEPSKAYVNNNDTFATAAKFADSAPKAPEAPADEPKTADDSAEDVVADEVTTETDVAAEAPAAEEAPASEETVVGYGEGSYVGENPPEGFAIKGNERSKKFHLPGSGGYERTIAEVWFNSEEAAEAAGFTRALR